MIEYLSILNDLTLSDTECLLQGTSIYFLKSSLQYCAGFSLPGIYGNRFHFCISCSKKIQLFPIVSIIKARAQVNPQSSFKFTVEIVPWLSWFPQLFLWNLSSRPLSLPRMFTLGQVLYSRIGPVLEDNVLSMYNDECWVERDTHLFPITWIALSPSWSCIGPCSSWLLHLALGDFQAAPISKCSSHVPPSLFYIL